MGFAAGEIAKIPLNLALLKGCQIVGVLGILGHAISNENMLNTMELIQWHAGEIEASYTCHLSTRTNTKSDGRNGSAQSTRKDCH